VNASNNSPRMLVTLALGLGLIGGVWFDRLTTAGWMGTGASLNFRLIGEAWNVIRHDFVERATLSSKTVTYGALAGMVDALGDTGHSRFLSPELVKQLAEVEKNHFQGIGAEVRMKKGRVVIVAPLPDSPAMHAGLKPGDMILKVNGEDVGELPLDQVVARISGPAGSIVTLTILNPTAERTREVRLTRAAITIHNLQWRRLPGTSLAHVHIAGFNKGIGDELKKALATITKEHFTGIILDLRNNPGGLLDQAVDVASQFLDGGNVLRIKNAAGKIKDVAVERGGLATKIPLVLLVNEGSASAAEIVAGALQDAHRGLLVGEKTFGTGTVLKEFPLSDGSALLLAIEEWLTPDSHVIWHKGITPDETIALAPDKSPAFPGDGQPQGEDAQLQRAVQLLEKEA
jgi:carboxyl-terminal processing protease